MHREKFCEEDEGVEGTSCLNLIFPFILAALLFFWGGQWMFNLMVCHIVGRNKARAFICMECVCLCESHLRFRSDNENSHVVIFNEAV